MCIHFSGWILFEKYRSVFASMAGFRVNNSLSLIHHPSLIFCVLGNGWQMMDVDGYSTFFLNFTHVFRSTLQLKYSKTHRTVGGQDSRRGDFVQHLWYGLQNAVVITVNILSTLVLFLPICISCSSCGGSTIHGNDIHAPRVKLPVIKRTGKQRECVVTCHFNSYA